MRLPESPALSYVVIRNHRWCFEKQMFLPILQGYMAFSQVLVGFSMGGGLAMELALRIQVQIRRCKY